jgi:hypothetical protein
MKHSTRAVAFTIALCSVVLSSVLSAQAASAQTTGETFGKCSFTPRAVIAKLIANEVKKDLTAKGITFPNAAVTFSNIKVTRKALSLADLTGVTGVTAQTDGSYLANVTGKIGAACEMVASLGIRVSGYNTTTKKRFSSFKAQQVTILGTYQ